MGWGIAIWLIHIISAYDHRMDRVQEWVATHLMALRQLTGQEVTELDFSDDRLAVCLRELHKSQHWHAIERLLSERLLRVYALKQDRQTVRLDATVGSVYHDEQQHTLFQVGPSKDGDYETQFKLMLASLDALGLLLAIDVVAGNRADDPLYVPCYQRVKATLAQDDLLIVGDSKMSALDTRAAIVVGHDHYLTPLPQEKDEVVKLLDDYLRQWQQEGEPTTLVFLPQDLPQNGQAPDPKLALAKGFTVSRHLTTRVKGKTVTWEERCLVVRSTSYQQAQQASLEQRLHKAETALRQLTPAPGRGKRPIQNEATLQQAIARIQKKYRVTGLFQVTYSQEVQERQVRRYKDKPARTEQQVRFQIQVEHNQKAIDWALHRAGWRIYLTNAPQTALSLSDAVLAYRDQYLVEYIFRRLKGKMLSITPVYVQRDDHAQGLFHLLSLAARLLALGDYTARRALAEQQAELSGVYAGNPRRATARPTMERMMTVFNDINLSIIYLADQTVRQVTALTAVQQRILALLGLPTTLYTDLAVA